MKRQNIRRLMHRLGREDGQGMTEYIIIVAMIAIAAIGVVTVFGKDIRDLFGSATSGLSGGTAQSTATAATVKGATMKTFNQDSNQGSN